ncbi:hypothetical protein HMPREF1545_04262 [Oscillibacter sp. KLE 1728]|nr:hypothetical protein HMPREF1545_04262 [Oscillibacter sp. KLE 1728]ERK56732.1 hypothetical protein HMPREF1546_04066 [Oscillibacter sp. KLE 1745]
MGAPGKGVPKGPAKGRGLGKSIRGSPVDLPEADQEIPIIFGRAHPRAASLAPAGQFTFCTCRKYFDPSR